MEAKELAEIGEEVYLKNKEWLEREHAGEVAALCEEGIAGIGKDAAQAYEKASQNHPSKVFYIRRIGSYRAVAHSFGV